MKMSRELAAKLIRALYWLLSGLRGAKNDIDAQVLEAMDNLWALADDLEPDVDIPDF
jgi:hypothetical protein